MVKRLTLALRLLRLVSSDSPGHRVLHSANALLGAFGIPLGLRGLVLLLPCCTLFFPGLLHRGGAGDAADSLDGSAFGGVELAGDLTTNPRYQYMSIRTEKSGDIPGFVRGHCVKQKKLLVD